MLYQIILVLKACEKSADFYNAKTCNFSTGPLLEGLTRIQVQIFKTMNLNMNNNSNNVHLSVIMII